MGVKHRVFHSEHYIETKATGELDLRESKKMLGILADDPRYPAGYGMLFDLRNVECNLTATDMLKLVKFLKAHRLSFSGNIAVVVSGCDKDDRKGAEFMEFCATNMGFAVRTFAHMVEAEVWVRNGVSGGNPPVGNEGG